MPSNLLSYVQVGKLLFQMLDLWRIVENNVWLIGMESCVVLVIGLGGIEGLQRHDLGDDAVREDPRLIDLRNVGFGDALLLVVCIEDGRAVLRAFVGSLAIELRRVVSHREEYSQQLAVSDLRWVVHNLDGFGLPCLSGADDFVLRVLFRTTRVTRGSADDTFHVLEDSLNTPETSASENRTLTPGG